MSGKEPACLGVAEYPRTRFVWSLKVPSRTDGAAVYFFLVLGDEGPAVFFGGGGEEGVEGGAGAHLVEDVLVGEVLEVGVVFFDEPGEGVFGFGCFGFGGFAHGR